MCVDCMCLETMIMGAGCCGHVLWHVGCSAVLSWYCCCFVLVVAGASVASDAAVTGSHVCLQCVCAMVVIMAVVVYVVAGGAPVVF